MGSSTTRCACSRSAASRPTPTTSFWAITSIGARSRGGAGWGGLGLITAQGAAELGDGPVVTRLQGELSPPTTSSPGRLTPPQVKYPENFFLLRGNHESSSINRIYGFYDECKRRYNQKVWKAFCDCFDCLPAAAVVEGKIFCAHGGLSQQLTDLAEIRGIQRPCDVGEEGLLCDLLWADPDKEVPPARPTGTPPRIRRALAPQADDYIPSDRGVSFHFGKAQLTQFLEEQELDLVVRAHQVVEDGYEFFGDRKLVTIFSAPRYAGEFDNAGAMMVVDENLQCSFRIFKPK